LQAEEICEAVFDALNAYQGVGDQYDDMTILAVEIGYSPSLPPHNGDTQ